MEVLIVQQEEENRRHNDDLFDQYLKELEEYKARYGDCNVPVVKSSHLETHDFVSSSGEKIDMVKYYYLGLWLKDVKVQFKIFDLKASASSLTRDQMKKLRDIGFGPGGDLTRRTDTSLPITVKRYPSLAEGKPQKPKKNKLWDEKKFISLQQFVQAMGHADVPQTTESKLSPMAKIRSWLNDIQEAYKKIHDGEVVAKTDDDDDDGDEDTLTVEQIKRLKDVGFDLEERAEAYRQYRKTTIPPTFEDKVVAWLHYRLQNDGMDPTNTVKEDKGHDVATWITLCRRKYKEVMYNTEKLKDRPKRKRNGTFVLTKDRIEKLTELGFNWEDPNGKQSGFEKRIAQLLDFKAEHGHLRVPQADKGLGNW